MTYTLRDTETGAEVELTRDDMERILYAIDLARDDYVEVAESFELTPALRDEVSGLEAAAEEYGALWDKLDKLVPDEPTKGGQP